MTTFKSSSVYHVGFSIKGDVEDGGEVWSEDGGDVGGEDDGEVGGEYGGEDGGEDGGDDDGDDGGDFKKTCPYKVQVRTRTWTRSLTKIQFCSRFVLVFLDNLHKQKYFFCIFGLKMD